VINQEGIDMLAQSVAKQVHADTGMQCGYIARIEEVGQRALFAFKVLAAFSHQEVSLVDLSKPHSWQRIYEAMIRQALEDTAPWALARKLALQKAGTWAPEIAPSIDQQGNRHFRMFCETGKYILPKGNESEQDDQGTAARPEG